MTAVSSAPPQPATARRARRRELASGLVPLLALTFTTGIVDAIGYLGLDHVFTANMTGNVVILGMALAGGDGLPVAGPAIALAAFLIGAAVSGRVLRAVDPGWTGRTTIVFGIVAALTAACAALTLLPRTPTVELPTTAALALAMGLQAAAARHLAVADVTTVVVTSTMTGLAADSWLGRRAGQRWPRRVLAIVLIGAGALVGALLLLIHPALGLGVAAVLIVGANLVGHAARG